MSKNFINTLKGKGLYWYVDIVSKTCQFHTEGIEELKKVNDLGKPMIVTSWHGAQMMLIGSMRKFLDSKSFITIFPDDYRGDILRTFVSGLGIKATLLNLEGDSTFEMSRKIIQVIRQISDGKNFVVFPDGPEGPAYSVKSGLTFIARKTEAYIVPVGCYCRNAYHVPRWDRYTLPVPFSKIHVQIGKPFTVSKDQSDLNEVNHHLENTLNRAFAQAAANYYEL